MALTMAGALSSTSQVGHAAVVLSSVLLYVQCRNRKVY